MTDSLKILPRFLIINEEGTLGSRNPNCLIMLIWRYIENPITNL